MDSYKAKTTENEEAFVNLIAIAISVEEVKTNEPIELDLDDKTWAKKIQSKIEITSSLPKQDVLVKEANDEITTSFLVYYYQKTNSDEVV